MGNLQQTQAKLIEEAIQLFATRGYKGTTIREIAKATGMTISNTYYHFGSKHGLLLAAVDSLATSLLAEMEAVYKMYKDPLKRLKELVRTHLDQVARNKNGASIFFLEENTLLPDANQVVKQVQARFLRIYQQTLLDMRTAGYLRSRNITVLAFHIIALVQWHFRWYDPEGKLSLDDVKKEALDFILKGILKNNKKSRSGTAKES